MKLQTEPFIYYEIVYYSFSVMSVEVLIIAMSQVGTANLHPSLKFRLLNLT